MSVWVDGVFAAGFWADGVWFAEGGSEEPAPPPATVTITPGMFGRRPWSRLRGRVRVEHFGTGGMALGGSAGVRGIRAVPPRPAPVVRASEPHQDYFDETAIQRIVASIKASSAAIKRAREMRREETIKRADSALFRL